MKVSTKCVKLIASTHEPSNCVSLLFDVGLGFMLIENNAITIYIWDSSGKSCSLTLGTKKIMFGAFKFFLEASKKEENRTHMGLEIIER